MGVPGLLSVRPHFGWGGVGAAKSLLPCFLVPKGKQPTACTLALWWLKFGPTEPQEGGGGGTPASPRRTAVPRPRASDRCKPGRQGSPPPASPSGGGGSRGNIASKALAQGRHRLAATRGLFALGFTRAAPVALPRDEAQGKASAPPRGSENPGKGHGRAHSTTT